MGSPTLMKLDSLLSSSSLAALLLSTFLAGSARADEPAEAASPAGIAPVARPLEADDASNPYHVIRPAAQSSGFMLGASLDYVAPASAGFLNGGSLVGAGAGVGVSAGYRAGFVYLGASYQHAFLSGGSFSHDSTSASSTSGRSDYVGVDFITISDPRARVAFLTRFSAGFRLLSYDGTMSYDPRVTTTTSSGFDVTPIGLGVQIKADDWLRIVPEASVSVGQTALVASIGVAAYFDFSSPAIAARRSASSALPSLVSSGGSPAPPISAAPDGASASREVEAQRAFLARDVGARTAR